MNSAVMWSKQSDEWSTPDDLFQELDAEFHFTLDPCSTDENYKCKKHYTMEDDGLKEYWSDEVVFCNPPYSKVRDWVAHAWYSHFYFGTTIVMLLPVRTDTKWFHDFVYENPDVEIRFIRGRLKFGYCKNPAPFPSMLVIFKGEQNK